MDEPDREIHTETNIDAYAGYLPDEWCEKVISPISKGTVLERLLLDLAIYWRSASYTAQMPTTAIRAMHAAATGRANFESPDSSIIAFSDLIISKLASRVQEFAELGTIRARLTEELVVIAAEIRDRAAAVKHEIPVEPMWNEFMEDVAFRISLWASQRAAYIAFYNAYEAFLVRCLKVGTGVASLRSTDRDFKVKLREGLGKDISGPCWTHPEVNTARLVRHALSHNDGRETEDLKGQKHGVKMIGDELQIAPEDNHRMLRRLRAAVEEIVGVVVRDSRFMAPANKLPRPPEE